MEKSTFISKIQNPYSYTLQEKLDIQSARAQYPYCAILQQMDVLSDKAASIYQWESRSVVKTSIYLIDAQKTSSLLGDVNVINVFTPEDLKLKRQIENAKEQEYSVAESKGFDVLGEINAYQEVSFKTAPKSVILSKFLEAGNCQADDSTEEPAIPVESLGKNSIAVQDSVDTETMAVILEKQGKWAQAVAIYEKLMSKYPEKSSTFAARIEELKSKINNK